MYFVTLPSLLHLSLHYFLCLRLYSMFRNLPPSFSVVLITYSMLPKTSLYDIDCPDLTSTIEQSLASVYLAVIIFSSFWALGITPWLSSFSLSSCISWSGLLATASGWGRDRSGARIRILLPPPALYLIIFVLCHSLSGVSILPGAAYNM